MLEIELHFIVSMNILHSKSIDGHHNDVSVYVNIGGVAVREIDGVLRADMRLCDQSLESLDLLVSLNGKLYRNSIIYTYIWMEKCLWSNL